MQVAIFCNSDPETMTEKRVEIYMLERLEAEQKSLGVRIDSVDTSLRNLGREVSELRGSLPAETPAWIRFYVYPACVLISAAMAGAVITLIGSSARDQHISSRQWRRYRWVTTTTNSIQSN